MKNAICAFCGDARSGFRRKSPAKLGETRCRCRKKVPGMQPAQTLCSSERRAPALQQESALGPRSLKQRARQMIPNSGSRPDSRRLRTKGDRGPESISPASGRSGNTATEGIEVEHGGRRDWGGQGCTVEGGASEKDSLVRAEIDCKRILGFGALRCGRSNR